ncbi:MAG: N-6 DNA methylase [Verrucomicrobiales bacterium]|nr:N-6 DNA methylase [Verrucomicrobiales bacterium]
MDMACGSGSLLLNVRKKVAGASSSKGSKTKEQDAPATIGTIGKIFGQDKRARGQRRFGLAERARRVRQRGKPPKQKNITTYNLARMNMLLHGVNDTEFEIFHGDTLLNEWDGENDE